MVAGEERGDMNPNLLLSIFPGIDLLGAAAEELGFCVVRGPDVLWGGDIRKFHPPAGVFGGVFGGPPCQCFSSLRFIVEHNGHKPRFGNMIPEFERCVREAQPQWFLMENVKGAPIPHIEGYGVHPQLFDNRWLGDAASRPRRISFGWLGGEDCVCAGRWRKGHCRAKHLHIESVALENLRYEYAAIGGQPRSGLGNGNDRRRKGGGLRRGTSCLGLTTRSKETFADLCRKQGLPKGFDLPGMTIEAKCQAVGNGVPMAMGRALFKAIRELLEKEGA